MDLKTFACYYGPDRLNDLAAYDLVILQPGHYAHAEVDALQQAGVTCLAYLSLGELPPVDAAPEWRLTDPHTGQSVHNPHWSTVFLDCRLAAWQEHVLATLAPGILARGFAGLFLDTLDVQEAFPTTRPGVAQLVRRLRAQFPDILLAANRGFSLLDQIAPCLDVFVFEAFTTHGQDGRYTSWIGPDLAWTEHKAAELRAISGGRPILALDYGAPEDDKLRRLAEKRAVRHDFLSFVTTHYLDWLPARAG